MEHFSWERTAAILFCLFAGGVLFYGLFRVVFPILLPFFISFALSLVLRPLSVKLSSILRIPRAPVAVFLLLSVIAASITVLSFSVGRLLRESRNLLDLLLSGGGIPGSFESFMAFLERQGLSLGIFGGEDTRRELSQMLRSVIGGLLQSISAALPGLVGRLITALPSVLFGILLTVISGFYFCLDGERITASLLSLFPISRKHRMSHLTQSVKSVLLKYGKAYLILWAINFSALFFGLLILGVDYAFLLSLLISTLDLLPIIGVGTVMIPWGAILLLQKQYYLGFGLLILYLAVELLRQIMEPRVIGKSLGLHPLLSLFATYLGFSLFGFLGMILSPIVALLVKTVLSFWRKPPQGTEKPR